MINLEIEKHKTVITLTELDYNETDGAVAIILEELDWKELDWVEFRLLRLKSIWKLLVNSEN
jgi:hypothetical protein